MEYGNLFQIGTGAGLLAAGFITGWLKGRVRHWKERKKSAHFSRQYLEQTTAHDLQIFAFCHGLRISTNSCRVSLFRFHNGEYFADGSPIQKVTVTHESVLAGFAHLQVSELNVASIVIGIHMVLTRPGVPVLVQSMPDSLFRRLFDGVGIEAVAGFPVTIGPHQIVGFVLVQWGDRCKIPANLTCLEQAANEIGNQFVLQKTMAGS